MVGVVEEVAATSMTAKTQCRSKAVAGLCSSDLLEEGQSRALSQEYGVVVLLAKNREKGSIPSFAISCFTVAYVLVSSIPHLVAPSAMGCLLTS